MTPSLHIDAARVQAEIDELATITSVPNPATTRVIFSDEDLKARVWVVSRFEALGLAVRTDAVGNIFARWEGTEPDLPAIATGSHIDAIPNAGRYDGVVGVLGPLEAFRALKAAGFMPRRSLEIIVFTSEEPTRFGLGCLGSRLMSGRLAPEKAWALADTDKVTLADWLGRMPWEKRRSRPCAWPRAITARSSSCTSSRARCWKCRNTISARSRTSRRQARSG